MAFCLWSLQLWFGIDHLGKGIHNSLHLPEEIGVTNIQSGNDLYKQFVGTGWKRGSIEQQADSIYAAGLFAAAFFLLDYL